MAITKSEINTIIKTVFLSIATFYLIFPVRTYINEMFQIAENTGGQLVAGLILITLAALLYKID